MSKQTAERIRKVATRLFAERGYGGTSVRSICTEAKANVNAVSYHFGGKQALYVSVLRSLSDERLASAQRILGAPPRSLADLEMRLLLFVAESLVTLLAEPELLVILTAETQQGFRNCGQEAIAGLAQQNEVLIAFLAAAQDKGLLRSTADVHMVAGALVERLHSQVVYVNLIQANYGRSILQEDYRTHWSEQTVSLLLYGAAADSDPAT